MQKIFIRKRKNIVLSDYSISDEAVYTYLFTSWRLFAMLNRSIPKYIIRRSLIGQPLSDECICCSVYVKV